MPTNESTAAVDAYAEAMRCWNCLTQRDECAITMRSIFVTVRLLLPNLNDPEDIRDVEWLLYLGQYLADIETYRPDEN